MKQARWMAPIATAILELATLAGPALAGSREPTGDRIDLFSGDDQTYPAETAFHIEHGNTFFLGSDAGLGIAKFTLDIDGNPQPPSYSTTTAWGPGFLTELVVFNFPDGMTGVHTFTGHWWAACGARGSYFDCDGNPPLTPVEYLAKEITVTFTTD